MRSATPRTRDAIYELEGLIRKIALDPTSVDMSPEERIQLGEYILALLKNSDKTNSPYRYRNTTVRGRLNIRNKIKKVMKNAINDMRRATAPPIGVPQISEANAIRNATRRFIHNSVGKRADELPMTPEERIELGEYFLKVLDAENAARGYAFYNPERTITKKLIVNAEKQRRPMVRVGLDPAAMARAPFVAAGRRGARSPAALETIPEMEMLEKGVAPRGGKRRRYTRRR
jgi:hypothetical protein